VAVEQISFLSVFLFDFDFLTNSVPQLASWFSKFDGISLELIPFPLMALFSYTIVCWSEKQWLKVLLADLS